LLPDAGLALDRIIWGGVDSYPALAAVIGCSDESIPPTGITLGLIVASNVSAEETDRGAAGAASDCFNFGRVYNSVSRAQVETIAPRDRVADRIKVACLHTSMAFRLLAGCNGLVVYIRVVNCAIGIDRNRWVCSVLLRECIWNGKRVPGCAGV